MTYVQTISTGQKPMGDLLCLRFTDSLNNESNYSPSRLASSNRMIGRISIHWFELRLYGFITCERYAVIATAAQLPVGSLTIRAAITNRYSGGKFASTWKRTDVYSVDL